MGKKWTVIASVLAFGVQPAVAQQSQSNVMFVAQALDRCMATYAVRLTKTTASDEQIYAEAAKGCAGLDAKLAENVRATVPPQQAAEFLKEVDTSKKPNFVSLLAKIRSDRAARGAGLPAQ